MPKPPARQLFDFYNAQISSCVRCVAVVEANHVLEAMRNVNSFGYLMLANVDGRSDTHREPLYRKGQN